jgi:pSer/pThr/pTyr-binding forkhead associated (FHA) protein
VANASLLVIHGPEQGARFELGEQPVVLGRGMQSTVRILDTEVSRMHAVIQSSATGFVLTDKNSSNGTFVNGAAVRIRELIHGDQIQIGRTVLLFADAQAEQPPPSNDLITMLQQHDPSDRSSIVSQVAPICPPFRRLMQPGRRISASCTASPRKPCGRRFRSANCCSGFSI